MIPREDLTPYKPRLRDYLVRRGVRITTTDAERIQCLNSSAHERGDVNPSMIVYSTSLGAREDILYCPTCGCKMDVFEAARIVAGLSTIAADFPRVIEEVKSTLGETGPVSTHINPYQAPGSATPPAPKKSAKKNTEYVSLGPDEARDFYTKAQILRLAAFGLTGKGKKPEAVFTNGAGPTALEGVWKNLNPDGTLALIEARFPSRDFLDGKKKYLSIWFDGEHLKSSNPPILLYNRDKMAADLDVPLIWNEGPKAVFGMPAVEATEGQEERAAILGAEAVPGFIATGWNSGGKKLGICDLEPLAGRRVYIYPDADEPGIKTARQLKEALDGLRSDQEGNDSGDGDPASSRAGSSSLVKICAPLAEAVERFGDTADIVEALQVRTPEELAEYILTGPALEAPREATPEGPEHEDSPGAGTAPSISGDSRPGAGAPATPRPPAGGTPVTPHTPLDPSIFPFRILGTADDGLTYFLDRSGRLAKFKLSTLTKNQLQTLAPLSFWVANFGRKGRADWDDATDGLIEIAGKIDFDPEVIRGTGAWREPATAENPVWLCYNDGCVVHGPHSEHRVYLRRAFRDIGIDAEPASFDLRREMVEAAMAMSFETKIDAARLLAWAILSPFGGALTWRPSGLITGDSESGKTTALNLVVRPCAGIGDEDICTGGESSGAGVRQHDRYSSRPVVIEEADDDTDKKKRNRDEIFSIMRESTSDDSPKAWKGTIDGQGMTFTMRKMFIFAAISPIVNANADRNRLFYVNMKKAEGGAKAWKPIKKRIQAAFSAANCAALRAFVWARLGEIIEGADFFSPLCEEAGRLSTRYAYLEATLFSAYHIVFKDGLPTEDDARRFLETAYELQKPEERTNEAEDMVERLLDEVVPVSGDRSKMLPLRSILVAIKTRKQIIGGNVEDETTTELSTSEWLKLKQTAWSYGLGVNKSGELCVQNNHHAITKITGFGRGYSKLLKRHPYAVKDKVQGFTPFAGEKAKQSTYIANVLETDEVPF